MKRIEIIEYLKGYAIFTIVVFHHLQWFNLPHPYDEMIFFGGTGIHLFILLSGLGLYLSHLRKPMTYIPFLKKRVVKIYVPYIIIVLLSALVSLFIPLFENSWYALGGHVFLYKMFSESIIGSYGYPLWFISMILQFYFIFLLLTWLIKKLGNKYFMVFSLAISLLWAFTVLMANKEDMRTWNSFFLQYLWEFALGMIIAARLSNNNNKLDIKMKTWHYFVFGVLGCGIYSLLAFKGGSPGKLFNDIPALIGYSFMAIWLYRIRIPFINQFFLFTGKISFSVYLLHVFILKLLMLYFGDFPVAMVATASLALTYLTSYYYQIAVNKLISFLL